MSRHTLSLDAGWRFHPGDVDSPLPSDSHIAAYMAHKAGWARGAARANFDDTDWRAVDLPHDWSVEGEISRSNQLDNGFRPRGVGWYRRHFVLDDADRGRCILLHFSGVTGHSQVYVNGHDLHRQFCGYSRFDLDLTDVARFGDDQPNVIAVRVDASPVQGWWYEGAGIYRHVRLIKTGRVRLDVPGGTFVRPEPHAAGRWETVVQSTLRNDLYEPVTCRVRCTLLDPSGADIGSVGHETAIEPRASAVFVQSIPIHNPRLWSVDDPALYALRTEVSIGATPVDEEVVRFGYRTTRFDPEHGFFLNDQPLRLLGTCNHQDHAGVGVAVPDSIHAFRIARLKAMGANAYRCAHHPPAEELLDACDRLGMLVIDENRTFGSSEQVLGPLRSMVRRDRNHPSVIAWSLCNEEAIQGTSTAANIARAMAAEVRRLDPTRPVTAAVSGGLLNDESLADGLDVVGINYLLDQHDAFRARRPRRPVYGAETSCVTATRGAVVGDPARFQIADDDSSAPPWGATARATWRHVSARPWLAGLFVWTGFDYRGEPTPHGWPCVSSFFGQLDTCGFEKESFWLYKAFFDRDGTPFVHLRPHWNQAGREGEPIDVCAYSNCEQVELLLNGRSLGRHEVDPIDMARWEVPFEPGTLEAIGFRSGDPVARAARHTTGPAVALGLEIHPTFAAMMRDAPADGVFAIPVTAFAVDAKRRRVPTADIAVSFAIDGPGRIIGVGNGDPTSHESDQSPRRRLFNGLAQVIVQTDSTPGEIRLSASASGLAPATLSVITSPAPARASAPSVRPRHFISDWRMSPVTADAPAIDAPRMEQDVNSWDRIDPSRGPQPAWARSGGFALYRATLKPPKVVRGRGGRVSFRGIDGSAEVFFDGRAVASKPDPAPGPLDVPIPSGIERIDLLVRVHRSAAGAGGITAPVEIVAN